MMKDRTFSEHEAYFQDVLEIARRHKIMNPEKMRTEYAKVRFVSHLCFILVCSRRRDYAMSSSWLMIDCWSALEIFPLGAGRELVLFSHFVI